LIPYFERPPKPEGTTAIVEQIEEEEEKVEEIKEEEELVEMEDEGDESSVHAGEAYQFQKE
jgi:hypothetical protein